MPARRGIRRAVLVVTLAAAVGASGPLVAHAVFGAAQTSTVSSSTTTVSPPADLAISQNVLTWTATTTNFATGYSIHWSDASAGPYTQIGTVSGRGTTTYTDTAQPVGTSYYLVRALAHNWISGNSNVVSTTKLL